MENHDFVTNHSLLKHKANDRKAAAEAELFRQYGERYARYRQDFANATQFEFKPEFPLYLMLEQTYKCNLRCPSCIQGLPEPRRAFDMDVSNMPWKLFEKVVLEGERYDCPSLSMHVNDEPLIVKDLPKRIEFARHHGFMDILMTTNGNLFTEAKVKDVIDAGVTRVLFSVDACTSDTYDKVRPGGDLDDVIRAMEMVKAYRESRGLALPMTRASFVVTEWNKDELKSFIEKFSSLVDYIDIQPFSVYHNSNTYLIPQGSTPVTNFHCDQPWVNLIVRANGQILPCCAFYGYEIVLGNAYDTDLYTVFNSNRMNVMRQEHKAGVYTNPVCQECSVSMHEYTHEL